MDIITAQQTLKALIAQRQGELDSLNLALSVLNDTFKPDMDAIKAAQDDADGLRTQVAQLKTDSAATSSTPAQIVL